MAIADAEMRALTYDHGGFDRSSPPWADYDYDTLSDDLADVMKDCDVSDAAIGGFSMGGGEVARCMPRHRGKGLKQAALVASVVGSSCSRPRTIPKARRKPVLTAWSKFARGIYRCRPLRTFLHSLRWNIAWAEPRSILAIT